MDDNWLKISCGTERDAIYQAGHAVIALIESLEVVQLFIEDDGTSWIDVRYPDLSQTRLSRSVRARSDAKSVICALLAGPAAGLRYSFGNCAPGSTLRDFNLASSFIIESEAVWEAISIAGRVSQDSPALIRSLWRRVNRLVHGVETWAAIEAVANALLSNGELAGCEVRDITKIATDPKATE